MELVFEPDLLSPASICYYTILSLILSSCPIPKLLSNRQRFFLLILLISLPESPLDLVFLEKFLSETCLLETIVSNPPPNFFIKDTCNCKVKYNSHSQPSSLCHRLWSRMSRSKVCSSPFTFLPSHLPYSPMLQKILPSFFSFQTSKLKVPNSLKPDLLFLI